jgi:hypothetical protein
MVMAVPLHVYLSKHFLRFAIDTLSISVSLLLLPPQFGILNCLFSVCIYYLLPPLMCVPFSC